MKKKSERLQPVKTLRERQLNEEARKLAQTTQALQAVSRQLNDLEQYLQGYYADSSRGNVTFKSAQDLMAYQQFIVKLNDAITRQRQMVALKDAAFRAQQKRWIEASANVDTIERLIIKARMEEQKKEDKREQKMVDELSTRLFVTNDKFNSF